MTPGQFCWNELATNNLQASKDFYGKVFGWKFIDHSMGDTTYTMIQLGDNNFGGIWSIPKDQEHHIPPHWMSYILVKNLNESVKSAEKAGASIIKPATQAGEMGKFAIITDPVGAHIAMWEPAAS